MRITRNGRRIRNTTSARRLIPEHGVSRCENDATGQYHVNGAFGDSDIYWLCDDCVTDTTDELIEPVGDQQ